MGQIFPDRSIRDLPNTDLQLEKKGKFFRIIYPNGNKTGWVTDDLTVLFSIYHNYLKNKG